MFKQEFPYRGHMIELHQNEDSKQFFAPVFATGHVSLSCGSGDCDKPGDAIDSAKRGIDRMLKSKRGG